MSALWTPCITSPTANGRVFGYARVSTTYQKLDHQLDLFARIECDKVFYDHGVSGGKAERPGLNAALKELCEGDLFVVYKLDRLGRSVLHLADLVHHFDEHGIHFCSLTEGIDTTTSRGRLIFHIFSAVAEFHRDLIRENTKNGLEATRKRGTTLGRPRKLTPSQVESAYVQMTHENLRPCEVAKRFGVSKSTVLRELKKNGFNCH